VLPTNSQGPNSGGQGWRPIWTAPVNTPVLVPLRILIAEAHPIAALGLADLLHKLGYVLVGSVASGPEAILAAGEHHPDLLLVDVDLRGDMDGIAAAVEIHNRLGIRSVVLAEQCDRTVQARTAEAEPVALVDKTSPVSVIADVLRIASSRVTH
jgi:DNA-binding NarL/FixJ family response regulator